MNDVKKHAWCKDAFKSKSGRSGELWLFLDSNQKKLSTVMTWWYCPKFFDFADLNKLQNKIPESSHPEMKPTSFLGISDRHSSKKRPQTLANPHATHMSSPRGLSPKNGNPHVLLAIQIQSPIPALKPFCFRLVRKGKSCFRRSEGKLFTNAEVIFIWKKTFQKCSIICLMKFVITEKDSIRSRRVSSPRIQKHHRICFISLICI